MNSFPVSLFSKLWNQPPPLSSQISFGDPRCSLKPFFFFFFFFLLRNMGKSFNPIPVSKKDGDS